MTSAASGTERLRHSDLLAELAGREHLQMRCGGSRSRQLARRPENPFWTSIVLAGFSTGMRAFVAVFCLATLSCDSKTPEPPSIERIGAPNVGGENSVRDAVIAKEGSPAVSDMDALEWEWDQTQSAALLRFPQGPVVFSVSCDLRSGTISFTRFAAAPQAGQATLSLTTPKRAASVPMTSVASLPAPSSYWKAAAPVGELDASVIKLFREAAPTRIAVADTSPLVAPPSDLPLRAFRNCRGR